MDYALGEVGLLPEVFWHPDFTWNDLERACRGYELRQIREWERARQQGEWFMAAMGVDLKKELKGKRLMRLPTDPAPKQIKLPDATRAEWKARMLAQLSNN